MKSKGDRIRVLMAKPGLDGHDRGALVVSLALRDAGMEVIYTGRHQSPEQIAKAAVEEDISVIGLSSLTDVHRTFVPKLMKLLEKDGNEDTLVLVGGFIPPEDAPLLKEAGVAEVFGAGSKLEDIIDFIRKNAAKR